MLVPGWTRLRNHGARAGSAFGGGSAIAVPASNITAARKNGLITRAAGFPTERTPFHDLQPGRRDARLEQRRGDAQTLDPHNERTRPVKRRLRSGRSVTGAPSRGFYDCDD